MTGPAERAAGGAYADVNGLHLYYEVHGSGRPLLLPGGLMTIGLSFGEIIPALAQDHLVIGVELQGHGHTAATDRPVTLTNLVDDVVALLGHLGLERADIVGFSLGGIVALELAVRRPERVGRLVVASVDYRPGHQEATQPDDPDVARRMPTQSDFDAMRQAHAVVAPDPDGFDAFAAACSAMVHSFDGWSDEEMRSISAPTLLVVGDSDFTPLPHAVAMHALIPGAQLAVLPDTTHMGVIQQGERLSRLVRSFLQVG